MIEETSDQFVAPAALLPAEMLQRSEPPVAAPVVRISRWRRLRRWPRLLLRRILYNLVLFWRLLRPVAAFLVVIFLLVGLAGWLGYQLWWPQSAAVAAVPDTRVEAIPRSVAVEGYIRGRQAYDAAPMWDAFSADYQAKQREQGVTKESMQLQSMRERQLGIRYVEYEYVGGVHMEDGGSMYFYGIVLELREHRFKLPLVFMADAQGKIIKVTSPQLD